MESQNKAADSRFRRLRGREARSQSIGTKLTVHEESLVLAAAASVGKVPSEWARAVLLDAAANTRKAASDSALFVEVQSVRLLLVNALEPLLSGERMMPEQFKELLRFIKSNKAIAAQEVLASYSENNEVEA